MEVKDRIVEDKIEYPLYRSCCDYAVLPIDDLAKMKYAMANAIAHSIRGQLKAMKIFPKIVLA